MKFDLLQLGRELVMIRDYCRTLVRREEERTAEMASMRTSAGRKDAEVHTLEHRIKVLQAEAANSAKAKKIVSDDLERKRVRLQELRAEAEAAREKVIQAEKKASEAEAATEYQRNKCLAAEDAVIGSSRIVDRLTKRLAEANQKAAAAEKAGAEAAAKAEAAERTAAEAAAKAAAEAAAKASAEAVAAFKGTPEYMRDFREAATDSYQKGFDKCFSQLSGLLSEEQLGSLQGPGRKKKQAATKPAAERQEVPPRIVAPSEVVEAPSSEGLVPEGQGVPAGHATASAAVEATAPGEPAAEGQEVPAGNIVPATVTEATSPQGPAPGS